MEEWLCFHMNSYVFVFFYNDVKNNIFFYKLYINDRVLHFSFDISSLLRFF